MTSVTTIENGAARATTSGTTSNGTYVSLYDQRVKLVADVLVAHSALAGEAATELAAQVLYVLDHIPERVRYNGR